MTAREEDINGFITVKRNPISKVGVFPYLGKSIDKTLDPNKIYWVYRPAEELCKPETIESFRKVPLIDDHTMLGKGATAAEEKGVDGVTGDNVEFDGDFLYADLKIFSESMKRKVISGEKTELSMGYRVGLWDPTPGVFNGQMYDFVQRKLLGNHIALVDEGRMGREVAVLDKAVNVFDSAEVMDAKKTKKELGPLVNAAAKEYEEAEKERQRVKKAVQTKSDGYKYKDQLERLNNSTDKLYTKWADLSQSYKAAKDVADAVEDEVCLAQDIKMEVAEDTGENKVLAAYQALERARARKAPSDEILKLKQAHEKLKSEHSVRDDTKIEDETALPHDNKTADDNAMKGNNSMAEEEKKAMSMDDVKAFIKGHAKDRKTFDKLMDSMRPAEDADEEKAEDADEEKKSEDAEEEKKAEDKSGLDAEIEDADEKKDAQDAAISGLRSELDSFKKNGMKTLMTEINKRNALAKEVEEAFGTFDHAEQTVDEVAAYGLKKAGITVPKGQEIAAWAGFNAGRKANRSVIGGSAMDRKEAPSGSLIHKTLNASK